jgi:hypothetical protein
LLANQYPDTFIPVAIHRGDGYDTVWGNSRWTFAGVSGTPTVYFDCVKSVVGAGSTQAAYQNYLVQYNLRMGIETDVTVDVQVSRNGNQCAVKGIIGIEAGGEGKDLRIHCVQVLDNFPSSPSYSRNTLKQGETHGDIFVNAGATMEIDFNFTLDAASMNQLEDVKFIVMAQKLNPSAPSRIYNAGVAIGPFDSTPGDLNCDGLIDFADINPFVLALTDPNGYAAQFPDCNIMNADINEDGLVDFGDINPFVDLLTSP